MIQRDSLLKNLYKYLDVQSAPEANGLQVEGGKNISKIVFGVSANMALFEAAKKAGADTVITHHGLIWDKPQKITGVFGARVKFLVRNNINLISYHLPLDKHPVVGNNACLARLLGIEKKAPFGLYHGINIGFKGKLKKAKKIEDIYKLLGGECLAFGPQTVKSAAFVSGGAHDMVEQAAEQGADLYICGSRDEYIREYCREAKINFIAMGHYNSEKLGVQALMVYIKKHFKVKVCFIDIPNPF